LKQAPPSPPPQLRCLLPASVPVFPRLAPGPVPVERPGNRPGRLAPAAGTVPGTAGKSAEGPQSPPLLPPLLPPPVRAARSRGCCPPAPPPELHSQGVNQVCGGAGPPHYVSFSVCIAPDRSRAQYLRGSGAPSEYCAVEFSPRVHARLDLRVGEVLTVQVTLRGARSGAGGCTCPRGPDS